MDSSDDSKKSFFKYVFNFDDDSKSEILNLMQYALLALIPVLLLNKGISKYIPESDDSKSSLEISAEIIIQVIVIFLGLLLINRVINFIPTYSGVNYPEINIVSIVLIALMIILSIQTKVGEKANLLIERLIDMWEGTSEKDAKKKNGKKTTNVKVSQPISNQQNPSNLALSKSYSDGTAINSLPTNDMLQNNTQNMLAPQQLPNYNNMFEKDNTPLVGASTPGMSQEGFMEPMAANSVLGGGFGSSW
jgi:hypothetical protein